MLNSIKIKIFVIDLADSRERLNSILIQEACLEGDLGAQKQECSEEWIKKGKARVNASVKKSQFPFWNGFCSYLLLRWMWFSSPSLDNY